jgi:hypothetical protein
MGRIDCDRADLPATGHPLLRRTEKKGLVRCPMTSNFPFCQLVVLDRRRLPLNFPRPAADGPLANTFMQPGNLPKWSPKRPGRQTSLSRVTALRPAKQANRTLCRTKIDNTDSSWQVSDVRRGIFHVTGHGGCRRSVDRATVRRSVAQCRPDRRSLGSVRESLAGYVGWLEPNTRSVNFGKYGL